MDVVLFEPEIPPNTGNIARLCAATGTRLHLVGTLGFSLDDKYLKRAGLDYWPHVEKYVWPDMDAYLCEAGRGRRLVMTSSKRGMSLQDFVFSAQDSLVFGPETRGLPEQILSLSEHRVRIPIRSVVRSLNLSTAAGIVLYTALIQCQLLDDLDVKSGA